MKSTAVYLAVSLIICAAFATANAGEVKREADVIRCDVSSVDSYDITLCIESLKKLNGSFNADLDSNGLRALAEVFKQYKKGRLDIKAACLAEFEKKRTAEYFAKLRLVKSAVGNVSAGKASLWGAGNFDRITLVVNADASRWIYESDTPFVELDRGGSGAGTRHNGPKITKQSNGVSVWVEVRGPDFTNSGSGHSWWSFRTKVVYKPTAAIVNPKVAADRKILELRLNQAMDDLSLL